MPEPLDALRARLAAAAAGVLFVSEGESPFTPVVAAASPDARGALTSADVRRLFAIDAGTPVRERALDDFFSYGTAPDPADAASVAMASRVVALRDLLRAVAPDARAFRVGTGPKVRYLIVGRTAEGGVAGVETVGFES